MYTDANKETFPTKFAGEYSCSSQGNLYRRDGDISAKLATFVVPYDKLRANLGQAIAEFCNQAHRLTIQVWQGKVERPTIFFNTTVEEIKGQEMGWHVLALTIMRKDGKEARFHLSLQERKGRIKATLSAQGRERDDETTRSVTAKFDDWESPLDDMLG